MMEKYKIGYTSGVYDLFHIGHLNIFRRAKEMCDYLIVGVSTDDVVIKNKNKTPTIPFNERFQIVESIRYVDKVISQDRYDIQGKINVVREYHIDALFVGSDWQGTEKWNTIEKELKKIGCDVIYLPHTDGISSTIIKDKLNND